jgi:enoyl-CoA hydratase/carnithine racemase
MTEPDNLKEAWPGRWKHIRSWHRDGVTELNLHSEGGPLIWNADVHRELPEAFHEIDRDPQTKVLILSGSGETFCDDIDLPSFFTPDADWNEVWYEGREMLDRLVGLNIPMITAVNGPARIHAELGVLADVVLAAPDTQFADQAHFTRGAVPGDGVHIVWPYLLGPTRGRYFLLTGTDICAEEALRLGFVHEIHPRETLRTRAWELAESFAQWPRPTLQYTRAALSLQLRRHFAEDLSHGLALQGHVFWARKNAAKVEKD